MKKVFIVFMIIVLSGCMKQEEKIELIKPTDENYIFIERLFSPDGKLMSQVYNLSDSQVKKVSKAIHDIKEILQKSEIKYGVESVPKGIPFRPNQFIYTLYINEIGKITKVVAINSPSNEVDTYLVKQMKDWEMEILKSDNRALKYSINWEFSLFKPKDKEYYSLLSSNLKVGESINLPEEDEYYVSVEEMPSPIGGMKAIQEKVRYPEIAKRAGVQGRVYVKAFIDENGNVVETEILRGVGQGLDEAAIEAIEAVKFNPGKQRGKPVKVQVSIPIMFKLN